MESYEVDRVADRTRAAQAAFMGMGDLGGVLGLAPCDEGASRKAGGGSPPPLLTGGERVAGEAQGVKKPGGSKTLRPSLVERLVMTATGEVKLTLRRHGVSGDTAFLDWINFTVDASAFEWDQNSCDLSEDKLILDASVRLEGICLLYTSYCLVTIKVTFLYAIFLGVVGVSF